MTPGMNDLSDGHRVLSLFRKWRRIGDRGSLRFEKGAKGKRLDALHLMEWTPTESAKKRRNRFVYWMEREREREGGIDRGSVTEFLCPVLLLFVFSARPVGWNAS